MGTTTSWCTSSPRFRPFIYINDFSKKLSCNTKLFADNTFIFSNVEYISASTD